MNGHGVSKTLLKHLGVLSKGFVKLVLPFATDNVKTVHVHVLRGLGATRTP